MNAESHFTVIQVTFESYFNASVTGARRSQKRNLEGVPGLSRGDQLVTMVRYWLRSYAAGSGTDAADMEPRNWSTES